jgi:tetratricopeptide (TPR) repeat protein
MNKLDAAVAEFSSILQQNVADDKVRYLLASTYEQKKDNMRAIEAYSGIAASSELFVSSQMRAALLLKNENKINQAIDLIQKAIKTKSDQILFYLFLSALYEETSDNKASERILKSGLDIAPKNIDLHYALGVLYDKTDRFTECVDVMKKILAIDPDNAEALNFLGYSYAERGINLDEAEKMVIRALEIKPGNGYLLDSLGWIYFKKNQMGQAEKYLKEALKLIPDEVEILEHMGDLYARQNKMKEAGTLYEKALKIDPRNISVQKKLEALTHPKP